MSNKLADGELRHRSVAPEPSAPEKQPVLSEQREVTELDQPLSSESAFQQSSHEPGAKVIERDEATVHNQQQQRILLKWLRDANHIREELVSQFTTQIGDVLNDLVHNIIFDINTKRSGGTHLSDLARLRGVDPGHRDQKPETKRLVNDDKRQAARDASSRLQEKQFEMRASVLTEMLQISHIRTVANMFTAVLIIFALNTLLHDLLEKNSPGAILDVDLFLTAFGRFNDVIVLWLQMFAATIVCVYPGFHFWLTRRADYWRFGTALTAFDYVCIFAYVSYQTTFLVVSLTKMFQLELPPASSLVIAIEQVRLMMKTHAFVRESVRKSLGSFDEQLKTPLSVERRKDEQQQHHESVLRGDEEDEDDSIHQARAHGPHFSQFLYFLFAPTLIYRDAYPRTRKVRWRFVVNYAVQFAGCVVFVHFIMARFCVPTFRGFQPEHIHPKQMLIWLSSSMIPGSLILFLGFYLLLHVWLNMFAEMLRFGDRLFYSDWWNSKTWARYYRTWNIVVHDWLYAYVYRDVCMLLGAKGLVSRAASMSVVFLVSAVFHEYIIAITLHFFYPVVFCSFMGAGFGFVFLTEKGSSPWWNIFMWFCLFVGTGVNLCLLCIEWYARQNCQPIAGHPALDFFIPRSWHCVSIDRSKSEV